MRDKLEVNVHQSDDVHSVSVTITPVADHVDEPIVFEIDE